MSHKGSATGIKETPAANRKSLWQVFGITGAFLIIEFLGGLYTHSLALLADAAHMLIDVGGLGLALFASWIAGKPASPSKTYGYYRAEVLASLANALVLTALALSILYEAAGRFRNPEEVRSPEMVAIATAGLLVNLAGMWILKGKGGGNLNMKGAMLEVASDAVSSLGAILAGIIIWTTGWRQADPVLGILVGLFILPRTWKLMGHAVDILLESAPSHINPAEVKRFFLQFQSVLSVHDLHIWSLSSERFALSAHVVLEKEADWEAANRTLASISTGLKENFSILHSTIQIESNSLSLETHLRNDLPS